MFISKVQLIKIIFLFNISYFVKSVVYNINNNDLKQDVRKWQDLNNYLYLFEKYYKIFRNLVIPVQKS